MKAYLLYLIFLLISSLGIASNSKNIVYITSGTWGDLFAIGHPVLDSDGQRQPTYQLKQKLESLGYEVKQANSLHNLTNIACIIAFDLSPHEYESLRQYQKENLILFLWEPPSVTPLNYDKRYHDIFAHVYTWNDDLVDNRKYRKFYYPVFHQMIQKTVPFAEKKLCTLIASNKRSPHPNELYSERLKSINFFETNDPENFDFYGYMWNINQFKTYRGQIQKKVDVLKHYKFCICYENIDGVQGYVTEKIFDCFHAGTIPIYWGAPNIEAYIPKNCFIDRRNFRNNEELHNFITSMKEDVYQGYIQNIRQFLQSKKAQLYSIETFVNIVVDAVQTTT